ncbi:hypothetical protein SAMN05216206_2771 [Pseudomonas guineae]|uniref:Uncharacterized protein n=1 Tax=Pseudomonas guineae TaxID=425504 RepID=A0A1I3KBC3_9PSED|nr:hypothetical protein [Pseudomonas guineae]SFI69799.1 hypothetical protein SAMN05216206_2771 [Pseudomonas guineae]
MDFIASLLSSTTAFFTSIDYTPLKQFVDLNDARNLAAIVGVIITVNAASKKWGTAAIYQAQIGYQINRPTRITSLSLANLKDKPLIIYRIIARFNESKTYVILQEFKPPLVIDGLKATTLDPDAFSSLDAEKNPFDDFDAKMDIILVTESTAVKCKPAKSQESLTLKHMKGFTQIGKSTRLFNKKVYTAQAAYALVYRHKDTDCTSFLLHGGHIIDEWPFRYNAISRESMKDETSLLNALRDLSEQVGTKIHAQKLTS